MLYKISIEMGEINYSAPEIMEIKMAKIYKPVSIRVWLDFVDVNVLCDIDQDHISSYNIDDDIELSRLMHEWIRPRYEEFAEIGQNSLRQVLEQSKNWTSGELKYYFDSIALPSGQKICDIDRFMVALRKEILI